MADPTPDSELLLLFARDRAEAEFAELVRRYLGLAYNAALRQLGADAHLAEDVTQRVFTLLAGKAASLTHYTSLAGWIHTTTRFVARETLRAEQRRRVRETQAQLMHELTREDATAEWSRLRPTLDEAIGELRDDDREAVLLRYFAGCSLAEVGAKLGLNENTARMRVQRALEKLQARLVRRGVTSTSAALGVLLAQQAGAAVPSAGLAASVTHGVLAATAASGTASVGAMSFMGATKWAVGVAGALALTAVVGVSVWRQAEARAEAAQRLAVALRVETERKANFAAAERAALQAEQAATDAKNALAAAKTAVASSSKPAESATSTSARASTASEAEKPVDFEAEGRAYMARNPAVKRALENYVHASLRFKYAPLYRELGLTEEQIRRFQEILGVGTGMGADTETGRSMSLMFGDRNALKDRDAALREILGDDGLKRWREYNRLGDARYVAAEVAGSLYFTETPLTPSQAALITQLVASERRSWQGSGPAGINWAAVIEKARPSLAAEQIAVLSARRADDAFNQFLNRPRTETASPAK